MSTAKFSGIVIAAICVFASVALMYLSIKQSWESFMFISLLYAMYAVTFSVLALIAILAGKKDN
jgi:hypothetical protein